MHHSIELPRLSNNEFTSKETKSIFFEEFDDCPYCASHISPMFLYAYFTSTSNSKITSDVVRSGFVHAMFLCPKCKNAILANYKINYGINRSGDVDSWKTFQLNNVIPYKTASFPFNQVVADVSPRFKNIYLQSLQAKYEGKDELVGIGYRKSIEFLIKDYLISINHEKSDKIPDMPLSQCIDLIDNFKIKNLAKASTWLGNDETHYVRKHDDKDLDDLERFLNTLVSYLSFEIIAEDATSFIDLKWNF